MKMQRGFTLIELVMVIVILGILAAVAMPKFVDMKTEANEAAAKGLAGGIASSAATQYAANKMNSTTHAYSASAACAGDYLSTKSFGSCSTPSFDSDTKVCTVTCDSATSTVTLP